MKTKLCEMLGIDFPLIAFSHCRDVVAAVSRAGGFGMLGAVYFSPEELEIELSWIDDHVDGRPYGVDIVVPENMSARDETGLKNKDLLARMPADQLALAKSLLEKAGVSTEPSDDLDAYLSRSVGLMPDTGERMMDVAFAHPITFVAHALGVPPQSLIDRAKAAGIPCGALVGSAQHARRQVEAGVDVIIAQGTEAGGHCGEVTTMVLVPEVIAALEGTGIPVLAAGGIVSGRQMAAAMTMGAAGAWTGSVWLPTSESELNEVMRGKLVEAGSRDTVRTRASTGKMCRQLRSDWTDAWDDAGAPPALPMPFQPILTRTVMQPAMKAAIGGNAAARSLVNYLVGQGIGLIHESKSARTVVREFMEDFADAIEHINMVCA